MIDEATILYQDLKVLTASARHRLGPSELIVAVAVEGEAIGALIDHPSDKLQPLQRVELERVEHASVHLYLFVEVPMSAGCDTEREKSIGDSIGGEHSPYALQPKLERRAEDLN